MTKSLEALKPGKYAILYLDNWDGEGDTYHTLANLEDDGRWLDNETGKQLLEYQGDEILKAWPLDDGYETMALKSALEQAQIEAPHPLINTALERDALRYRFIRDKDDFGAENEPGLASWDGLIEMECDEFDAAIDARMAASLFKGVE